MIVLTVNVNGEERDVTAADIKSLSIEAGIVMVKLKQAKEKFSLFVSGIKLTKSEPDEIQIQAGRGQDGIK